MSVETLFAPPAESTGSREPTARRIKVCHLSLTLNTGGLERLLVDFARYHDADRFELEFATFGETGQPAHDIVAAGCEVFELGAAQHSRVATVLELVKLLRQRNIDVLHTHNAFPHVYGSLAARIAGVPVVVQTRHGRRFGGTFKERVLFAIASRASDCVVAVSADTQDACRRLGWLNDAKVARIVNGIDLDRFCYHGVSREPIAISVARLSAEKDFGTLLKAVSLVVRCIPDFRLKLVGDGPERESLKRLASDLHIEHNVEFLGERRDVARLLSGAAMFVSSSLTEGMSLTLLEAMAVGLPVIATNVGGNPETVEDGRTAVLVPPQNPEALADAMIDAFGDPVGMEEMGRNGTTRVERYFSVQHMVRDYEHLYEELLETNQREPKRRTRSVPARAH